MSSCAVVNECEEGLDNCDPLATCIDQTNGFVCVCPPGFTGDGTTCYGIHTPINSPTHCIIHLHLQILPPLFPCTVKVGFAEDNYEFTEGDGDVSVCVTILTQEQIDVRSLLIVFAIYTIEGTALSKLV